MRKALLAAFGLAAAGMAAPAIADGHGEKAEARSQLLSEVLAHPRRGEDVERDRYRNPAETIDFFRLEPGMTLVDFMPARGWYTKILIPYLGPEGRYIGVNPDYRKSTDDRFVEYGATLNDLFREREDDWRLSGAPYSINWSYELDPALKGTADRVFIIRELHNLSRFGLFDEEVAILRDMLKPDGLMGVVQHRAPETYPRRFLNGQRGYMRTSDVIRRIEAAGFELIDRSEINANPKDTADWPIGVWELPPYLGTGREELLDIGESDRMTLLFKKK